MTIWCCGDGGGCSAAVASRNAGRHGGARCGGQIDRLVTPRGAFDISASRRVRWRRCLSDPRRGAAATGRRTVAGASGISSEKKRFWEYDTAGSRVITDLSTNAACWCLTSQIGRDVVLSPKYGRTQQTARGPLEVVWWRGAGPFPGAETGKKKLAPFGACSKDFRFVRPESFSYQ